MRQKFDCRWDQISRKFRLAFWNVSSVRWDVQIGQERRTRKILWQKDKKDFVIYDPESDCHLEDLLLVGSSTFVEMIKSEEKVGISADDYIINGVESAVWGLFGTDFTKA